MTLKLREQTLVLEGGKRLSGSVEVGGSKNATLGAMAASLLVADDCFLENVPNIDDVEQMALVLRSLGCLVEWTGDRTLRLNAAEITSSCPDRELVGTLRGSFLVMGALLGRLGEAACPPPGGDIIGQRPIDVHLAGFRSLGAETEVSHEMFRAQATELRGSTFFADYPSVLGTQNTMMAAVCAKGVTTIVNAAAEPEVQSLAAMLNQMGADIAGAGTNTITIKGVTSKNEYITDYLSSLNACDLLSAVNIKHIKEKKMDDVVMREFEITAIIRHDADARSVKPPEQLRQGSEAIKTKRLSNAAGKEK
ncbi:MAG: hypothetical protein IIA90_06940 [Chloroflexi bacterium]|nr:hypothetical protein [Chloroflexota bacterium]